MIDSVRITNTATFGSTPQELQGLSRINFFFGSNGSGKTTISRIIADEESFRDCRVKWKNGTKLQAMVYNQDFVDKNFNQTTELKGVFTLGENNRLTIEKITSLKREVESITKEIETLMRTLGGEDGAGGQKGQLADLEEQFKQTCWLQKKKYDGKFSGAFEGLRNSSEKFKARVLEEWTRNKANLKQLVEFEKKAETLFGSTPLSEPKIIPIETMKITAYESHPILKKRVIGKEDVDIAAMIKKLGNSDWVREGRSFYESSDGVCPFCQQPTTERFAKSLEDYFDETFLSDLEEINKLENNYFTESARLQKQLEALIEKPSKFMDVNRLMVEKKLFDSIVKNNMQKITEKKKEPSRSIGLESTVNVLDEIAKIINLANEEIADHNSMVANLQNERIKLTSEIWKYILEVELKSAITDYMESKERIQKAISEINDKIYERNKTRTEKLSEIGRLEKTTTSVQPTIDEINDLLRSFGFRGFSLAKSEKGNFYKLVRSNGVDAKATLSEGERNFVTFLYFFHLLKGSNSDSGISTDRVVVFDDPVSSLDCDVLFIVSSLIKKICEDARRGTSNIKQVFILTHNIYFHKEVSFNPNRREEPLKDETFWMVRKAGEESTVKKYDTNPINTAYELLWSEIKNREKSLLTIQNVLRRIIEYYFIILGGFKYDDICDLFEGKDKIICRSLFCWAHDGSHNAHDDLYIAMDESTVDSYLRVFQAIFEKTHQMAHYKMMMGDAIREEGPEGIRVPQAL